MRIGVTGASGFVGSRLVVLLRSRGLEVVPIVRQAGPDASAVAIGDLGGTIAADVAARIGRLDGFVHLAAETAAAPDEQLMRRANVEGTRNALALASAAGARHFVFVSTVKVHGETSSPGMPFTELSELRPADSYARSKAEAENLVMRDGAAAGMAWTVVRPPLIYGRKSKANMASLLRLATAGMPLPLGRINNRRSIIFVDNLCAFILTTLIHDASQGEAFLVSDVNSLSTSRLIRVLAAAAGHRVVLVPAPVRFLTVIAKVLGKGGVVDRLFGDLVVSQRKAIDTLDWSPPISTYAALRQSVVQHGEDVGPE